jgi:solute carrier family 10 (sodium/bile acid cotransporter), member 7
MEFLRKNWFLIALLMAIAVGYYSADRLSALSGYRALNWTLVAMTMFCMAWPIEFGQMQRTVTRPLAPLLAFFLNVFGIPLMAWPFVVWLGGELGPGMMIAAATPSTLATATVLSRRAGGDDSIPMLVTILTNGTCFLVMPLWIYCQSGRSVEIELLNATVINLLFFVVIPIVVAQLLRMNRNSAAWATRNKSGLGVVALIGILFMVTIGSISMGLRMNEQGQRLGWWAFLLVGFLMGGIHLAMFWGSIAIARALGLARPAWIAVGFASSQKTLMVGLSVAISLGVSIVPIILYHSIQLIVDTLFADYLKNHRSVE